MTENLEQLLGRQKLLIEQAEEKERSATKARYFALGFLVSMVLMSGLFAYTWHESDNVVNQLGGTIKQVAAERDACLASRGIRP